MTEVVIFWSFVASILVGVVWATAWSIRGERWEAWIWDHLDVEPNVYGVIPRSRLWVPSMAERIELFEAAGYHGGALRAKLKRLAPLVAEPVDMGLYAMERAADRLEEISEALSTLGISAAEATAAVERLHRSLSPPLPLRDFPTL